MIDHQLSPDDQAPWVEVPWWLDDAFYGSDEAEHAAWLAGLPADVRAEYEAGPWDGSGESMAAGFLHHDHDGPAGAGFASGGAADGMVPGPVLSRLTADAVAAGYPPLGESELIGVLCAWQRLTSWAQAGQAAAVIALAWRRTDQSRETRNPHLAEHVSDEIAAALRLTGRGSGRLLEVSSGLRRLPEVLAALEAGAIDWAKACLFVDMLADLSDEDARAIARKLLDGACDWTSGQLRAALARAVLQVDPDAAQRRKGAARKDTEVQIWHEPSGNAALAGRELNHTDVIHADVRLTAFARWLQQHGATGTVDQLRSAVYMALLSGRTIQSLLPPAAQARATGPSSAGRSDGNGSSSSDGSTTTSAGDGDGSCSVGGTGPTSWSPLAGAITNDAVIRAAAASPTDRGWPQLTGTINLTMPMSTWLGLVGSPGEVAGHGPVDASTSCELATSMDPAARWCLTLTGSGATAVAHACAPRPPGPDGIAWAAGLRAKLKLFEGGDCSHARQSGRYAPPPHLAHMIRVRQRTCSFPGCRRAAARCDIDHTVPYDQGGKTCECNLAPLCRRHHRAKQAPGWHLEQTQPGLMTWRMPSGRVYETTGDPY